MLYTIKIVHFMDVSYTHEMYVFNMSHFLRTVCTNIQDMRYWFSKKNFYCDNILKWVKNFYYLFLKYLILHYQTAVVVLRHMEIVMVLSDHKIHDGYLRSLHGVGTLKAQGLLWNILSLKLHTIKWIIIFLFSNCSSFSSIFCSSLYYKNSYY